MIRLDDLEAKAKAAVQYATTTRGGLRVNKQISTFISYNDKEIVFGSSGSKITPDRRVSLEYRRHGSDVWELAKKGIVEDLDCDWRIVVSDGVVKIGSFLNPLGIFG